MTFQVAIVSRDEAVRLAAARAFASAPPTWSVKLYEEDPGNADVVVAGEDVAAQGDVIFDSSHPSKALRAVEARSGGRVYVVAAAAGGVGATTIAAHLAASLGGRVCYAELAGPSARLGLPSDTVTWLPRDGDVASSALPVAGGFRVLRAPRPCPEPGAFPLAGARRAFDTVVLDAGPGLSIAPVVAAADAALVVTTPTRPAALAARDLVESFPDARWCVVVNRLGPGGQIMRSGLEGILGRPVTVELPCCPALRDAEDEARLLTGSWRRWTLGIARLARFLDGC